eukprot:865471-Pleurochrysis_carterae.AAC.1
MAPARARTARGGRRNPKATSPSRSSSPKGCTRGGYNAGSVKPTQRWRHYGSEPRGGTWRSRQCRRSSSS